MILLDLLECKSVSGITKKKKREKKVETKMRLFFLTTYLGRENLPFRFRKLEQGPSLASNIF